MLDTENQVAQAEMAASDFYRDYEYERERREILEVVAAALYLGHDDAKDQFDMYKAVYLDVNNNAQQQKELDEHTANKVNSQHE